MTDEELIRLCHEVVAHTQCLKRNAQLKSEPNYPFQVLEDRLGTELYEMLAIIRRG